MIFISVVRDARMYDRVIRNNPCVVGDGIILNPIDNSKENAGLPRRYNEFLEQYDYSMPSWLVFCHEDWEILESISEKLKNLDKRALYGSFGARMTRKDDELVRQYVGKISDCTKDGGNVRTLGSEFENLTRVDTLDCQALIVHSSLVDKYRLRFDEEFSFDLYVEDFCLTAFVRHEVLSRVLNLRICHWSQIFSLEERPDSTRKYPYLNEKFRNHAFAGMIYNIGTFNRNIATMPLQISKSAEEDRSTIYQTRAFTDNEEKSICLNYILPEKRILDVGCACGDFAAILKERIPVTVWGMELNQGSIDIARKTGAFEDVYKIDLNNFNPEDFTRFYDFFDYIVFGDVLEHINFPQTILKKFKKLLNPSGEFILSIPNIAHASIKANLLLDDFSYTPCGLLDETHVKFFTYKTIASFLADINLEVVENRVTYWDKLGFQGTNPYSKLDVETKKMIFNDVHSYVLQYVMRVKVSDTAREKLNEVNLEMLQVNEKNSPPKLFELKENDLFELNNCIITELSELKKEIAVVKSSKFWKLRNAYLRLTGSKVDIL